MTDLKKTNNVIADKNTGKILNLSNMNHIHGFAKVLKKYINDNKLSVKIGNNDYAMVDGWKFALLNFGIVPIVGEPIRQEPGKVATILYRWVEFTSQGKKSNKLTPYFSGTDQLLAENARSKQTPAMETVVEFYSYKCSCDLISVKSQQKIGSGFAICTNLELKKVGFDEYSVASMAQTRSIGKAARNLIGFVMNAAGFEGTPAEEMEMSNPVEAPEKNKDQGADDNKMIDVTISIGDCKDIKDLEIIWNDNTELHSNNLFKKLITNKKNELNPASTTKK